MTDDLIERTPMVPSAEERAGECAGYYDDYGAVGFGAAAHAIERAYRDGWDAALAAIEASGFLILPAKLPHETRERATIPVLRLILGKGDGDAWDAVDAVWNVLAARPRDAERG